MDRNEVIALAKEAGIDLDTVDDCSEYRVSIGEFEAFAALVAEAERKLIMDSLQKQADLATDALDRRWALEMIAAVAARGETK